MAEIVNKGLEVKRIRKIRDSDIGRIAVTGYDTGLPREHVERELEKLFSSCGEITDVHIPNSCNSSLWRYAFVYFVGEGAVDKALQLNGSDMGGWTVDAEVYPFLEQDDNRVQVQVKGYDPLLSESDLKCELSKLFSSCGKVDHVRICKSFSMVYLVGEDAIDKAPKLSGTDMGGGHKVSVRFVAYQGRTIVHPRRVTGRIICGRPNRKPKMAENKEDEKPKMAANKEDKKPKMRRFYQKPKMAANKQDEKPKMAANKEDKKPK